MKRFFQKWFGQKKEINYLYFCSLLLFLSLLSYYLNRESAFDGIPLFFFLYALGQSFLEVGIFVLIAYLLMALAPRWIFLLFISLSFILMLLHYTHFVMVRLLDTTIGYPFKFLFGSGIAHFIAGCQALNMNWTMVGMIGAAFLLIPLAGLGFYWLTSHASKRKPLFLSLSQIIAVLGAIGCALFILDLVAHPFLNRHIYSKYQKRLPLGTTFIPPACQQFTLAAPLSSDREENPLPLPTLHLAHKPNIYFFIIETLRRDFITEQAAPHLTAFGQEHIQFPRSFANASSTHLSWFALLHSDLPFHWAERRDRWEEGSIPLRFLKQLGYTTHVYSSADLRYYQMDKLLFGKDRKLIDHLEEYTSNRSIEPCERDALAFKALKRDLPQEGQLFLIFLDSTHSEYSFPLDFPLAFTPISKEIDYLTIGPKSPELEGIKNRYRNAIRYVDHLMGDFFAHLKAKNLYDDAIIFMTGDHGEEFFEEGALFHGTHLNSYQTSVPIFLKFPSNDWTAQTELATHIDLFPSLLHYLTKQSDFSAYFDGQSIFSLHHTPHHVAVLQNGPDTPLEFSLENPVFSLRARILDSTHLEIVQLQGALDPTAFNALISR